MVVVIVSMCRNSGGNGGHGRGDVESIISLITFKFRICLLDVMLLGL